MLRSLVESSPYPGSLGHGTGYVRFYVMPVVYQECRRGSCGNGVRRGRISRNQDISSAVWVRLKFKRVRLDWLLSVAAIGVAGEGDKEEYDKAFDAYLIGR